MTSRGISEVAISVSEVAQCIIQNDKVKPPYKQIEFSQMKERDKDEAKRRIKYVEALLKDYPYRSSKEIREEVIREVALEEKDNNPPSEITLYRWAREYKSKCEFLSLVPRHKKKGISGTKLSLDVAEIVHDCIDSIYLNKHRYPITDVYDAVEGRINATNLKRSVEGCEPLSIPNITTIYRIKDRDYDPYDVIKARYGEREAERRFKQIMQGPRPKRVLERVEIDATKVDLMVVDEETRKVLGRPWLIIAVDVTTRMIIGYYLSFQPPNFSSVAECLKHSIAPKDYVAEMYPNIKNSWECYGYPETIATDNGRESDNIHFVDACLQLGIDVKRMPVMKPWYKATVERSFAKFNRRVFHNLQGTTLSNPKERGDKKPEEEAAITLSTLENMIHVWIIDDYQLNYNKTLKDTPQNKWRQCVSHGPPRKCENFKELAILLGKVEERAITPKGIELQGLLYNSPELARIRLQSKKGQQVKVKYNPLDMASVYVIDEQNACSIEIPAIDEEYTTGLTEWKHELYKQVAMDKKGTVDRGTILWARDYVLELAAKDVEEGKKIGAKLSRLLDKGARNTNPGFGPDDDKGKKKRPSASSEEVAETLSKGYNELPSDEIQLEDGWGTLNFDENKEGE